MRAVAQRRLVHRACAVCEWQGMAVETGNRARECPWCHAPTRIFNEEWLVPDPAAVKAQAAEFGRQGGLVGGRIRAQRLSAKRRAEIARQAAQARWRRNRKG
ncbi:MAG: hypothetical protein DMG04_13830 [Acidobacteria bacterium]|nr:MAG: hypothetical protein DMG04_13830 [Acidobacteriota bacterium]PYQ88692.1 MAG: hypothetical protein DMG03_03420 [Acidobacteriota bacterium]PYR07576.1 MAG: hypothetical protein DMF99_22070 [Acidobacteriota bacterium]PYR13226.1 MAG: hypothetical protein DMG00_07350 [Acidobacteriota bacterium]